MSTTVSGSSKPSEVRKALIRLADGQVSLVEDAFRHVGGQSQRPAKLEELVRYIVDHSQRANLGFGPIPRDR